MPAAEKPAPVRLDAQQVRLAAVVGVLSAISGTLIQLALPAVLLRHWPDSAYALVIAVQGLASYVGAADAGVQNTVLHRLAVLTVRGDLASVRRVARSALLMLTGLVTVGAILVGAGVALFGSRMFVGLAPAAGVTSKQVALVFILHLLAAGTAVALGGWATAVEYSRGRYVRVHGATIVRAILGTGGLMVAAVFGFGPVVGLVVSGIVSVVVDLGRFVLCADVLRGEPGREPFRSLVWELRAAPLYPLGNATSAGLLPAALSIAVPDAAVSAIPARTVANGARLISNAVGGSIWAPMAARLESLRGQSAAQEAFLERAGRVLAALQAGSVGGLLMVAPVLVPLWVPSKSAAILNALPFFLAEQVVFVVLAPAQVALLSAGRFGLVGASNLVAGLLALALSLGLVPRFGPSGFGAALTLATLSVSAPVLLVAESRQWRALGVVVSLKRRAILAASSAIAVVLSCILPLAGVVAAVLLVLLAGSGLAAEVRARRGGRTSRAGS